MSQPTTKERILDAAESIMLGKSFHSVGLNEILKAVGVPKGSFYHHFGSKEEFGVEMLKHYLSAANAAKRRMLLSSEPEPDPRLRLLSCLECGIGGFLEREGRCPCLVVKLAAEVSDFSEPMRKVLAEGQEESSRIIEALIREGIERKTIAAGTDPALSARLVCDLWSGAMQRATIARSARPLREALGYIGGTLVPAA